MPKKKHAFPLGELNQEQQIKCDTRLDNVARQVTN